MLVLPGPIRIRRKYRDPADLGLLQFSFFYSTKGNDVTKATIERVAKKDVKAREREFAAASTRCSNLKQSTIPVPPQPSKRNLLQTCKHLLVVTFSTAWPPNR
jgi:hypothetical protein